MLTPMSITSLDQGRDLARWHVTRVLDERPEAVADVAATPAHQAAVEEAVAKRRARPSRLAALASLLNAVHPLALWRS